MDIFEKAHNGKKHPQEKKAEQNTKKQLRQMLYGYRHNDPKAIRRSAEQMMDLTVEEDYSSFSEGDLLNTMSIEGFSSLRSSGEPDIQEKEEHNKPVPKTGVAYEDNQIGNMSTDETSSSVADDASISEYNDEMMSLPDESDVDQINSPRQRETAETSTSDSGQFDDDGELAAKIISRLEKRQKDSLFTARKKIKVSHLNNLVNNWSIEDVQLQPIRNPDVIDTSCQTNYDDDHVHTGEIETSNSSENVATEPEQQLPPSDLPQAPYVLYQAEDFREEALSDVIRGYNYSTFPKKPSDLVIIPEEVNNIFPAEIQQPLPQNPEVGVVEEEELELLPPPVPFEAAEEIPPPEDVMLPPDEFEEELLEFIEDVDDVQSNDGVDVVADSVGEVQSTEIDSRDPISLYYTLNSCVIVMKHPATLYIHGKVIAQLLGGAATIHGYSLTNEPCEIYAPNYNHAQYIETIEQQNNYYGLFGKLTAAGLNVAETEEIVTTLGEFDAILHLKTLKSKRMDFVEKNFTVADLFSKPSKHISEILKQASEMLGCSLYMEKPTRCFIEKSDWTHVARFCAEPRSRGIVCGGKGTGKSTFLRYYINRCLATGPVLVIDLDPGQSEFTVAGSISVTVVNKPLIGPNFTHLKTPNLMYNIGMISVMDNLRRYTRAISELFVHCYSMTQYKRMPWIINTMGMCNKIGLKLTTLIILLAQPMFVMQLDSKNPKKRYECYLNAHAVKNNFESYKAKCDPLFRTIYASPQDFDFNLYLSHEDLDRDGIRVNYALAARDERYLCFLSYFGGGTERKNASLLSVVPYQVPLQALKIASNVKFNEEAAYKVLNGKVVALCQAPEERTPKIFTLQDQQLPCHGHALIRGTDIESGSLFIVTPEPLDRVCQSELLLYADWVPELRIEAFLPDHTTVPYRTGTLQHQRQLMFTAKRRFNPIQYMKFARST